MSGAVVRERRRLRKSTDDQVIQLIIHPLCNLPEGMLLGACHSVTCHSAERYAAQPSGRQAREFLGVGAQ